MNFLAHCLIAERAGSGPGGGEAEVGLVAGGFLADFIKGTIPQEMPPELALGVRLHRRIDAYSNSHPDIRVSCDRFPAELRRIAPILVDIICDHLLARNWHYFHSDQLPRFTASTYERVAVHGDWLPDTGHQFLTYARDKDLLARYDDWSVTSSALRSITRRLRLTRLDPLMEGAVPPLLAALEVDFGRYFPDMIDHATDWVDAEFPAGTLAPP